MRIQWLGLLTAVAVCGAAARADEAKKGGDEAFLRSAKEARSLALERKQPCVILVHSDMWAL